MTTAEVVTMISTFLREQQHLLKDQMKRMKSLERRVTLGVSDDEEDDEELTSKRSPGEDDGDKGKKGKKLKKKKDPNAPKRPRSAYLFFVEGQMKNAKEEYPDMKQAEVFKQIGEKWRVLSSESKEVCYYIPITLA